MHCAANYWAERDPQIARADEYTSAYPGADQADYYARIEPQVMFRDILVQTGRERRAQLAAARG